MAAGRSVDGGFADGGAEVVQNTQPGGGGGQEGSGVQSGPGTHPGGGLGQLGGE
ncbi:hypothetical protein [Mycolicibacterium vinylchloridicum]|uniref:hypothetical protein n=1 Tax=Mycolicibacterium vinylchloridicum TaxID=2736928 RepID=UPI0015C9F47D|nr:hypothetical protein [Mycolicibacterium vinylchloridicum]